MDIASGDAAVKMLDNRYDHIPQANFALIGINEFDPFGDQVYTMGQFDNLNDALKATRKALESGFDCFVLDNDKNVYLLKRYRN